MYKFVWLIARLMLAQSVLWVHSMARWSASTHWLRASLHWSSMLAERWLLCRSSAWTTSKWDPQSSPQNSLVKQMPSASQHRSHRRHHRRQVMFLPWITASGLRPHLAHRFRMQACVAVTHGVPQCPHLITTPSMAVEQTATGVCGIDLSTIRTRSATYLVESQCKYTWST